MNPFVFLTVLFGTIAILLLYALLAMADSHRQLREINQELCDAGNNLVLYCDALELRNAYVESELTRLNDLRAAAIMFLPSYRVRGEKMGVAERMEAP